MVIECDDFFSRGIVWRARKTGERNPLYFFTFMIDETLTHSLKSEHRESEKYSHNKVAVSFRK